MSGSHCVRRDSTAVAPAAASTFASACSKTLSAMSLTCLEERIPRATASAHASSTMRAGYFLEMPTIPHMLF